MQNVNDNIVVFDWNGTILSDTAACVKAMNVVLKELGLPPITRAVYQKHYTMPLDKLYHAVGIDPVVLEKREAEIHPLWHATYGAEKIRLRRGAKTMLHELKQFSCKSVILSNYVTDRIVKQAKAFDIHHHFDDIIAFTAEFDTFRRRGKGLRLHDYLKANPAKRGLIVGDTEEEIEIGREHGLTTVAITDGMCSVARLRAQKPDFLITSLHDVPAIAHRVFGKGKIAP